MKNRTAWWVIGFVVIGIVACVALVGVGVWVGNNVGDEGTLAFGDAIAIVRVEGTIQAGEAPPPNPFSGDVGGAYSQTIIDYLKRAEKDEDVKAIILYVDSPGGSVVASDEIALQVKAIEKPIIAMMGSLAASGGYYVSAPTNEIWATPHTLTCSIGVISQFLNVEQFSEEYGITAVTITSGPLKDTGNPFREFNEQDRELWQSIVDEAYDTFVAVVVEGRDMSEEDVRAVADGRICSGMQAQEMHLVDSLGYLPDAIDRAAELGGIEDAEPRIIEYEENLSFFEALSATFYRPTPVQELQQLLNYSPGSPLMYLYQP